MRKAFFKDTTTQRRTEEPGGKQAVFEARNSLEARQATSERKKQETTLNMHTLFH